MSTTKPIVEVRNVLKREVERCGSLELFLTGGPRIAVVSALIASLLLPQEHVGESEGSCRGEVFKATLEVSVDALRKLPLLDDVERRILAILSEHEEGLRSSQNSNHSWCS